jgi:hypothetical protein
MDRDEGARLGEPSLPPGPGPFALSRLGRPDVPAPRVGRPCLVPLHVLPARPRRLGALLVEEARALRLPFELSLRSAMPLTLRQRRESPTNDEGPLSGPFVDECFGGDLLSHPVSGAVPSALEGLTSGFGMGPGVSPPLWPPKRSSRGGGKNSKRSPQVNHHGNDRGCEPPEDPELDSEREQKPSPRPISTGRLNTLPCLHLRPIYLVVSEGPYSMKDGRPHLGASFALRCFQRLSLPYVANQPCRWRDNWHTRGTSAPVLSYWGQLPSSLLRPRRIGTDTSVTTDRVWPSRRPGHFCLALHVAMQVGPYLHRLFSPPGDTRGEAVSGVWSLRILDASIRWILRYLPPPFMEQARSRRDRNPSELRCFPSAIARMMQANVRKSCCLLLRRGCDSKKGTIFVNRSIRFRTT